MNIKRFLLIYFSIIYLSEFKVAQGEKKKIVNFAIFSLPPAALQSPPRGTGTPTWEPLH